MNLGDFDDSIFINCSQFLHIKHLYRKWPCSIINLSKHSSHSSKDDGCVSWKVGNVYELEKNFRSRILQMDNPLAFGGRVHSDLAIPGGNPAAAAF